MEKEFEAIRDDKLRIGLLGLKRLFEANAKKMTKDEIMAFDFTFMNIAKALIEFEALKESNPNEVSFIWLNQRITRLEDDLQHYTMVEKDKALASITEKELNHLTTIKQALLKAQELEKENADVEKVKSGKVIIHNGKDLVMMNKAKYYEYVLNENEPVSKRILQAKCEEQEKILNIIKGKDVDMYSLRRCETVEYYNTILIDDYQELTEEEFDLLKRWVEND